MTRVRAALSTLALLLLGSCSAPTIPVVDCEPECSSRGAASDATAPRTTCSEDAPCRSVPLPPDQLGRIDVDSNPLGIEGQWRVFGDSYGPEGKPPGVCQAAGHLESQCSLAREPDSSLPGFPNFVGTFCTEGSTAQVLAVGDGLDYANMWGIGIEVSLAERNGAPQGVFDAAAHQVVGISFDIALGTEQNARGAGMRVLFDTPFDAATLGPSYWGAAETYPPSHVNPGHNVVLLDEVVSPEPDPRPLDTTQITQIGFLVPAHDVERTNFNYCIGNLEMLLE